VRVTFLSLLLLTSITFASDAAAKKAIAFLEKQVTRLPDSSGTPRKQFVYATTGLVYLMDPNTRTGPSRIRPLKEYLVRYVDEVERRLKDPASLPERHGSFNSNNLIQYTWPLAQTLLFFGELKARGLYGAEMKRQIPRLVAILEKAQDANGGWGHGQVTGEGGGYPSTLVAASNCVAIAIGSVSPEPALRRTGQDQSESDDRIDLRDALSRDAARSGNGKEHRLRAGRIRFPAGRTRQLDAQSVPCRPLLSRHRQKGVEAVQG
jgi:hypothetical protein